MRKACVHAAGTPCTDFSSQGKSEKTTGHTMLYFIVWAAQRLLLQEDGVLHENVPEFVVGILVTLLGSVSTGWGSAFGSCDAWAGSQAMELELRKLEDLAESIVNVRHSCSR